MADADAVPDYMAEVRFGIVMYGGVSLAVYVDGVAGELYEMACATPKPGAVLDDAAAGPTREIYRRLAWLVGNPGLRERYAERIRSRAAAGDGQAPADAWDPALTADLQPTRLVVDVIAGTSAGGINGVFLAKALANGEPFAPLRRLWLQEADIARLLNDRRSYAGLGWRVRDRSGRPESLLNGDRMTLKLLEALQAMGQARTPRASGESPLVDELDLFVTATDIAGSPVVLRLSDKVVHERRHRQSFHLRYPDGRLGGGNDFAPGNDAFLAFAARCTSSFPFAFEPMTLDAMTRLRADGDAPGVRRWDAGFDGLPRREVESGRHVGRAFGDGGYLDNKPFSYVADTLSDRQAALPLERKLVYIEPSPELVDPAESPDPDAPAPDALVNSLAALSGIPRYETIREDLQAVLQRNRRIERVERLVRLGEADIEAQPDPFAGVLRKDGKIPPWSEVGLAQMVRFYGVAFLPYHRLRVYSVTDRLAQRLAVPWGIEHDSDRLYALRALVRVWRDAQFGEEPGAGSRRQTINAFLDQFDLDYRIRRLGFLLRKTDQLMRLLRARRRAAPVAPGSGATWLDGLSESDQQIVKRLREDGGLLQGAPGDDGAIERALAALHRLKRALHDGLRHTRAAEREARSVVSGRDEGLRGQLDAVLALLLGSGAGDEAGVLALPTLDAATVRLALPPGLADDAAGSRTLQERVVIRAQALMSATGGAQRTQLQQALEADLDAMRVKPRRRRPAAEQGDAAPEPAVQRIGREVWQRLGEPRLALVAGPSGERVEVQVGAVGEAVLDSGEGRLLRRFLGEYYLRFDAFDQMSFPLYYDTGTGEPTTVEVVRVSPQDAPNLIDETDPAEPRRKLAGTALFSFGAFLDERWRRNDLLWGRLDGAERLIDALLPMPDAHTALVRQELTDLAHRSLLREALVPAGRQDLTDLLCRALEEVPGRDTGQRLRELLGRLNLGDGPQRDRLAGILASLLGEQGLLDYVRQRRDVDRDPEPKTTLDSAARAVTITGRVLEGIGERHGCSSAALRWLARSGLLLQGLLAVSLPGSLRARWWTHGLKLLYAFEAMLLAFALLFGSAELRSFAFTALGVTLAVHLSSLLAGDLMRARHGWFRLLMAAVGVALLLLAGVGALAVRQLPWSLVLCGPDVERSSSAAATPLCRWLPGRGPTAGDIAGR